jgi:hypothetical protein
MSALRDIEARLAEETLNKQAGMSVDGTANGAVRSVRYQLNPGIGRPPSVTIG